MIAHAAVERPLTGEPASIALVEPDEADSARQQLVGVQTLNPHARPRRSLRPLHRAAPGRPASRSDRCKSHRANCLRIRRAVTAHARLPGISRTANILAQPIAWPSAERSSPRGAWSHCWVSPVSPPHRLAGCNEYGGIEYGGLPVFHAFAAIPPVPQPHRGFATKVKRRLSNIRSAYSVTPSQDSSFEVPAPHGDCFW
jgi:hypothetical protein